MLFVSCNFFNSEECHTQLASTHAFSWLRICIQNLKITEVSFPPNRTDSESLIVLSFLQDPAVIKETGLCVWHSGPKPALDFKTSGSFLHGRMALFWTGQQHVTFEKTDVTRDYGLVEKAGKLARQAVLPAQESLQGLAEAVQVSYQMQRLEGMAELPSFGELAKKYCGGGWGGYAVYLFDSSEARDEFLRREGVVAIEPYIHHQ